MSPARGQALLEARLGARAMLARSAGRWSVVVVDDVRTMGSGVTITEQHRSVAAAVEEALGSEAMNSMARKLAAAITSSLAIVQTTRKCPRCGARKVVRIAFGATVLGHSCRACKWERPEG